MNGALFVLDIVCIILGVLAFGLLLHQDKPLKTREQRTIMAQARREKRRCKD